RGPRARPPARHARPAPAARADQRTAAPRPQARPRDRVHRRRPGHCCHCRERVGVNAQWTNFQLPTNTQRLTPERPVWAWELGIGNWELIGSWELVINWALGVAELGVDARCR